MMRKKLLALGLATAWAASAVAADAPAKKPATNNQPIEVSSDKLDVFQDEHKAIFTGNVIAVQGTSTMRAAQMVVFYTSNDSATPPPKDGAAKPATAAPAPAAKSADSGNQGIQRIEATGNVVFTTPEETAQGDKGIYNVETDTIDLVGSSVTLTRDNNVLKGTKLNYNMGTGRSVLTSENGTTSSPGAPSKPARVHGLFVPKSSDKKPGAK